MHSFFVLATFIASVFAIQVTSPRDGDVWSVAGPHTVTWTSVNTDPSSFKMVLVNPDGSVTQELAAQVTTSDGKLSVNAPSSGFPVGTKWKINFMGITTQQTGILAQSGSFDITTSGATTTGATTTGAIPTTMSKVTVTTNTVSSGAAGGAASAAGSSSTTAAELNPTNPNSASGFAKASGALMGAASLLYVFVL